MNGEERTWLQGQLNFLGAIITQGREQEHANANENARRLIETLERQTETLAKIAGGVDLLHKDANANARRLNALLAKAGLPDPNYEAQS